jgi:hypothetical protein
MDPQNSLSKYSKAVQAVKDHQEKNREVFDAHKNLLMQVIDAEGELRDAVAENGASISDESTKVTVTPQTQTWADIPTIDALITQGKISATLRTEIVKTQQRPPRITISEVKTSK